MTNELDEMRAKIYNLGLKDPSLTSFSGDNKLPQYNLLYRPWCIMDEGKYSWGNFEKIFEGFKNWPKSKLMNLRDAFLEGREEVVDFMIEARSKKFDVCEIDDVSYESLFDVYDMTVVIGQALMLSLPFPPLQTVRETFASYGFPTISRLYGDKF